MENKTICDICVLHSLPLRMNGREDKKAYCQIDMGLNELEGKYRHPIEDDDYNFECTYKTVRQMHSRIFGGGLR